MNPYANMSNEELRLEQARLEEESAELRAAGAVVGSGENGDRLE